MLKFSTGKGQFTPAPKVQGPRTIRDLPACLPLEQKLRVVGPPAAQPISSFSAKAKPWPIPRPDMSLRQIWTQPPLNAASLSFCFIGHVPFMPV